MDALTLFVVDIFIIGGVVGGLFWLGIELKSRGFFNSSKISVAYGFSLGIAELISFIIIISMGISMGYDDYVSVLILLEGIIVLIISTVFCVEIEYGFSGLLGYVISLGAIFGYFGLQEGSIVGGIIAWFGMSIVIMILCIISLFIGGILGLPQLFIIIIKMIAKSKYNNALNNLKYYGLGYSLDCLKQSLDLLKESKSEFYDKDLADKIISLKSKIELIQIADEHYQSKNYREALRLYEEIMNSSEDLKEILKEKYNKIKKEYKNQLEKELKQGDDLFKKGKLNEALNYYKGLLNKYLNLKELLS
jgi:hypothetical protein